MLTPERRQEIELFASEPQWDTSPEAVYIRELLAEIDRLSADVRFSTSLVRDVVEGGVCNVWHDKVQDEYTVAFHGPWVLQAEALLHLRHNHPDGEDHQSEDGELEPNRQQRE